jgi:hypothetical protein
MKAGIVTKGLVYAMGVDPGGTSGVSIIGVHERTIYRDYPGRISYFEAFEVSGGYTAQALEIAAVSREFYPLALIVESFYPAKPITSEEYLSPIRVGERIAFCVETSYLICPFFWQTPSQAMSTATDTRLKQWGLYQSGPDHMKDSTRHAITFIRRAKESQKLREAAWGPAERIRRPARRGISRSVRRLYY